MKTIFKINIAVEGKVIEYKAEVDEECVGKLKIDNETFDKMRVELASMVRALTDKEKIGE